MKKIISGLCCLFLLFNTNAQVENMNKQQLVQFINQKAKEAEGMLKIYESGSQNLVEESSFELVGDQVLYKLSMGGKNVIPTKYTFTFDPSHIGYIFDNAKMPKTSPIGVLNVQLNAELCLYTAEPKKKPLSEHFQNTIHFNYLKVDPENFKQIQKAFYRLKDLMKSENDGLAVSISQMSKYKDFWIATPGASATYKLQKVYSTGCNLYLFTREELVAGSGKTTGEYLTILPLSEIKSASLDEARSRPNTPVLQAGKKGFRRYYASNSTYKEVKAATSLPLFIEVPNAAKLKLVIDSLATQVKACGGKLKD